MPEWGPEWGRTTIIDAIIGHKSKTVRNSWPYIYILMPFSVSKRYLWNCGIGECPMIRITGGIGRLEPVIEASPLETDGMS